MLVFPSTSRTPRSRLLVATDVREQAANAANLDKSAASTLGAALLRSGRLDRKIEFPHPNEDARAQIMEIHARKMNVSGEVNYEELARSTDDFNAAQLKAVCVEAGMLALRRDGTEVNHEDFNEGIIAVQAKKKADLFYYT